MSAARARTARERRVSQSKIPRYELTTWKSEHGLVAGVTGREGGFDLGLASPDPTWAVLQRWSQLRDAVAHGFDGIVVGYQLHGCSIEMHPSQFQGILIKPGQDGHITQLSGVLLAVTVADCVPVYLAHPQSATLGLLHVGWRGAAGGMVESGIERVCSAAGVAPANVLMHCGVCICGECYEVGPEVIKEVNCRVVSGPTLLDLRSNLVERAATCGVEDVTVSDWCTAHHAERFYSHRASGGEAGRMIAYLGRPST